MLLSEFYYPIPQRDTPEKKIVYDCEKCGILQKRALNHAKISPSIGKSYDGFVIVPTNPTHEEDIKGILLTSSNGTQLRSTAYKVGFNLLDKAAIVPLIRCAVGKPTDMQGQCCFPELDRVLKELKPKVIVPIGDLPFKYIMHHSHKIPNTLIRNRLIPNYFYNAIVFPIWNINEIQGKGQKYLTDATTWDIQRIIGLYQKRFKARKKVDEFLNSRMILKDISIRELKTIKEVDQLVDQLNQIGQFSYDYETTNVYPYDEDFEIITIAFGLEKSAFVIHEDFWKNNPNVKMYVLDKVKSLLVNPKVKKIIQNSKFEDLGSRLVMGVRWIENMECTMLASHVIDERAGGTSLDFQNLIRFGIPPYNQLTEQYLKPKDGARVNRIRECPREELIHYTGLDVITTYNNWHLIDTTLFQSYPKARENYEMLRKGHWTYANMQQRGITLSESECNNITKILDDNAAATLEAIYALPEFIEFNEYMRTKSPKKTKDKQTTMHKLEEKINASRLRSELAQPDNRIAGSGISESLRDRIAALKRTVTFQ